MKRGSLVFIFLFLIIGLSFVSAGLFNKNKLTGEAIDTTTLSCDNIFDKSQYYFKLCHDNGFGGVCFNKYSGAYQGCGDGSGDYCVRNNFNAAENVACLTDRVFNEICIDSDGGLNTDVYGTITGPDKDGQGNQPADYCWPQGNGIMEGYCDVEGYVNFYSSECLNGCVNGACVPVEQPECSLFRACPDGESCVNGECINQESVCIDDTNCPPPGYSGEYCYTDKKIYRDRYDYSCINNQCFGEVESEFVKECLNGEICMEGRCISSEQPECSLFRACPDGESCVNGECYIDNIHKCIEDYDCNFWEHCDSESGFCVENPCVVDADCYSDSYFGQICVEGECVSNGGSACTDSDDGYNIYTRGKILTEGLIGPGDGSGGEDYCFGGEDRMVGNEGEFLVEYFCCEEGGYCVNNEVVECPMGCLDGACLVECYVNEDCPWGICTDGVCVEEERSCVVDATECNLEWENSVCGKVVPSPIGNRELCEVPGILPGHVSAGFSFTDEYSCAVTLYCPYGCIDGECKIKVGETIIEEEGIYTCKQETESKILCGMIFTTEPLYIVGKKFLINDMDSENEVSLSVDDKTLNLLRVGDSYSLGDYNLFIEDIDYDPVDPLGRGVKFGLTLKPSSYSDTKEVVGKVCEFGCMFEDKCYPFGYRKSGKYCSDESEFVEQIKSDLFCENSFECRSNLCIDDECVSQGLMKRLFNWLRNGSRN